MNRRHFIGLTASGVVTVATALPAAAHGYKTRTLEIAHPWTFEQQGKGVDAVIGMTIRNKGRKADALLRVEARDAAGAELRDQERILARLEIAAGGELTLHSNGPHILLKGVRKTLFAYNTVHITLVFANAGKIKVEVVVEDRPG